MTHKLAPDMDLRLAVMTPAERDAFTAAQRKRERMETAARHVAGQKRRAKQWDEAVKRVKDDYHALKAEAWRRGMPTDVIAWDEFSRTRIPPYPRSVMR